MNKKSIALLMGTAGMVIGAPLVLLAKPVPATINWDVTDQYPTPLWADLLDTPTMIVSETGAVTSANDRMYGLPGNVKEGEVYGRRILFAEPLPEDGQIFLAIVNAPNISWTPSGCGDSSPPAGSQEPEATYGVDYRLLYPRPVDGALAEVDPFAAFYTLDVSEGDTEVMVYFQALMDGDDDEPHSEAAYIRVRGFRGPGSNITRGPNNLVRFIIFREFGD